MIKQEMFRNATHKANAKLAAQYLRQARKLLETLDPAYNGEWDGLTDLRRDLNSVSNRANSLAHRYDEVKE